MEIELKQMASAPPRHDFTIPSPAPTATAPPRDTTEALVQSTTGPEVPSHVVNDTPSDDVK